MTGDQATDRAERTVPAEFVLAVQEHATTGRALDGADLVRLLTETDCDVVRRSGPPTVTLAALFQQAADHVDDGRWDAATAFLDVVSRCSYNPQLSAYRMAVDLLAAYAEGVGVNEVHRSLRAVVDDLRVRVYDLLVRGPDAPAATGKETS